MRTLEDSRALYATSERKGCFGSAVPGRLRAWLTGPPTSVAGRAPPSPLLASVLPLTAAASALVALTLVTYLPILPGSFLMDDLRLVQLENPLVTGQLKPSSLWFQTDFPLSTFTFWAQWLAWGKNPAPYHVLSIALHALSAVLVWRLLMRLKVRGAWLAGALFAVHPVCVNSVARIAELKNTLSLPFFLVSIACYLRYEAAALYPGGPPQPGARRSGTLAYALSLLAFVLALLSKTSTVMLPMVLLAGALWQRGKVSRRDLAHTGPHFALALAFGLMSVWFQKYQALAGDTLVSATFAERLIVAARAIWFYLGKALLPLNLNLVYPRWTIDAHSLSAFLPLVLLGAGLALCWRFRRSWGQHALFGLGCFAITLFPGLGFFDAKFLTTWQVSDHLQYLPLLAPVALAAAALGWLATPKHHGLASAALLVIVCALGFQRARVFASEEALMRDTLARNPAAASAHNDLGVILANRKDLAGALTQFTAAAQSNPKDAAVQSNLGQMLGMLGNLREAETHLVTALALKPFDADAHARLAKVLSAQNRDREARLHLRLALRLKEAADTRLQLAGLLYKAGDIRAAVGQFRQLLRTQPGHAEALNNLAWLLATCADEQVRGGPEAVQCAERACRLTGFKQSVFLSTLAAAYADAGRFPEAIATAERALRQQSVAGEARLEAINQQLLTRYYRAGKPYRERPVLAEAGQASL